MAKICELTGVTTMFGQNVSHSNRKTKTQFLPNLCNVSLMSTSLNRRIKLKITAQALRSVDIKGGLDNFILSRTARQLTNKAKLLKKQIQFALEQEKTSNHA